MLRLSLAGTALTILASPVTFALSVTLQPVEPSPKPVGGTVRWITNVTDTISGNLRYRFRTREAGQPWHTVVDYGLSSTLDWTEADHEGTWDVEVSVRDLTSGATAATSSTYRFVPRATDTPVISRTDNPLVALYSAPSCPDGSTMRVTITAADGTKVGTTPAKACVPGRTMNFYLAGMKQFSSYTVQHSLESRAGTGTGPAMTLNIGSVSPFFTMPRFRVLSGTPNRTYPLLLHSALFTNTIATDLAGNLVWYYAGKISSLTRPAGDGRFFGIVQPPGAGPEQQLLRKFDLAGTTLAETSAERVSEQLVALKKNPISAFHHEALALPDGRVLVLGASEQWVEDPVLTGKTAVIGDTILLLDKDLQVVWAWDSFDHLDVRKGPTLGETCTPVGAGCPSFSIASEASDWLHGNSLQLTPDGAILYSSRHWDQVLKIDFAGGSGSGNVVWTLGAGGDFSLPGGNPDDWFSHQHDPKILSDGKTFVVYDNGNVRRDEDPSATSRGQVYVIDEQNLTARLVLSADLGIYSAAVGSAQALPGGTYHFSSGFVLTPSGLVTRVAETDGAGRIVYESEIEAPNYRTFRLPDLYAAQ